MNTIKRPCACLQFFNAKKESPFRNALKENLQRVEMCGAVVLGVSTSVGHHFANFLMWFTFGHLDTTLTSALFKA